MPSNGGPALTCCNCETYGWTFESSDVQQCQRCKGVLYCSKVVTSESISFNSHSFFQLCQLEHFNKVHKKHCKYFHGSKVKESSLHNPYTCQKCIRVLAVGKQCMTLQEGSFMCFFEHQAYLTGVLKLQKNKKVRKENKTIIEASG